VSRPVVYVLVFEGYADWEPALAMCEVRKSGKFDLKTVGFERRPVTSMGGLKVEPDLALSEMSTEGAALFVLPGGDMWEQTEPSEALAGVVRAFDRARVPIAAICGATVAMARLGLLDARRHASNAKAYLKEMAPQYRGESLYDESLAVRDGHFITASGLGPVEFAREIIELLGIYSEADRRVWWELFKNGVMPSDL